MTQPIATIPAFEATNVQLDLRPRSLWNDAWRRVWKSPLALTCLIVTIIYLLMGIATFFPVFDHRDKDNKPQGLIWNTYGNDIFQHPQLGGPGLWFGTDIQQHSVFWDTLYGARVALEITIGASVLAIGIGVVLGVISGYFGGWVDSLIIWLFSTVSSVPWVVLVIALVYVLDGWAETNPAGGVGGWLFKLYSTVDGSLSGMLAVILAMGLTDWVGLCRLIRGEVLALRQRDFVIAAQAAGLSNSRILFRHILPNVTHIVIITFSLGAVGYVQAEVVLSFIGLGVKDRPSWGRMIDDAKVQLLRGVWWPAAAATLAIFILCLALNYLGDILRDALDPRLRGVN